MRTVWWWEFRNSHDSSSIMRTFFRRNEWSTKPEMQRFQQNMLKAMHLKLSTNPKNHIQLHQQIYTAQSGNTCLNLLQKVFDKVAAAISMKASVSMCWFTSIIKKWQRAVWIQFNCDLIIEWWLIRFSKKYHVYLNHKTKYWT